LLFLTFQEFSASIVIYSKKMPARCMKILFVLTQLMGAAVIRNNEQNAVC